eukprot:TRINITY_DN14903_c0_g1_i1.p3 TRINITY_DN14903_c0_g1~~TRINITY_DN14903_c0_g1_i1.p3  ORF type:complete len:53 (-),score=10.61 TRINITY_DN14903_c0_g1_i1:792-950(-)
MVADPTTVPALNPTNTPGTENSPPFGILGDFMSSKKMTKWHWILFFVPLEEW